MRRLVLMTFALLLLASCAKKARVAIPPPLQPSVNTTAAAASSPTSTDSRRPSDPGERANSAGLAASVPNSELVGLASYYAEPYHGRKTANGETFDTYEHMTAAHRTLPFNTVVKVRNQDNGREVEVRINDRGPFVDGRVIDLSFKAAREIDMIRAGLVQVRLEILELGTPPARGSVRANGLPADGTSPLYAIQVGAFESQDKADSMKRELERRYRDVSIQAVATDRTFYRVRVGRTEDLKAAEKLADQLRYESFDPFVVRLN